jgi:hypothetical protein
LSNKVPAERDQEIKECNMVQVKLKKLTFDEYLHYSDKTDQRYELIDRELIAILNLEFFEMEKR